MSWVRAGREQRVRRLGAGALALAVGCAAVLVSAAAPAQAAPQTITGGSADWGVKASFRSYVTGPIAGGAIAVSNGATANPGGTFHFVNGTGSADTGMLNASFGGTVHFTGHAGALDMTITDLHVTRSGTTGAVVADVTSKNLGTGVVDTYDNTPFATLDYSAVVPSTVGTDTSYTAVPAVLTSDGAAAFAGFYPAGTTLDPVTFTYSLPAPPTWTPTIVVSKTSGVDPVGETVTVTGTGFNPSANQSTRPPVPVGLDSGIYVTFGRFADTWRPSQGAPSSARKVIDQKWALPAASKSAAETAFGPNPQYVVLGADGSFTTTLHLSPNETFTGTYGIATYAAGGAPANASQETFTPVSFVAPTGTDASASVLPYLVRGQVDTTRFRVAVTNVDTDLVTVNAADIDVRVSVNGVEVSDPITAVTTVSRKLKATKLGTFTYEWTHGDSLQAGDVVEVTACVHVPDDDGPVNDCGSTVSPDGAVDLAATVKATFLLSKRNDASITAGVINAGDVRVLLRPSNVHLEVYVNDVLSGGTIVPRLAPTTRSNVLPTKVKNYAFTWTHPSLAIGDVVRIVSCVPVPGDVTPADNCTQQSYTVLK